MPKLGQAGVVSTVPTWHQEIGLDGAEQKPREYSVYENPGCDMRGFQNHKKGKERKLMRQLVKSLGETSG